MPREHPRQRILKLLEEALRRDIHFVARHRQDYPRALFQCLWNSCWWHDSPAATTHGSTAPKATRTQDQPGICDILAKWRFNKESEQPGLLWLRSLRPFQTSLLQRSVIRGHTWEVGTTPAVAAGVASETWTMERLL